MKVFMDFEFFENGKTIDVISVGMMREDGEKLYLVNSEADFKAACRNPWLFENVIKQLGIDFEFVCNKFIPSQTPMIDLIEDGSLLYVVPIGENVVSKPEMAEAIMNFCGEKPQFYGWFSAYDHVALSQLFGQMINLPAGYPYYTHDLKQTVDMLCMKVTEQIGSEHNALSDAEYVYEIYKEAVKFADSNNIDVII